MSADELEAELLRPPATKDDFQPEVFGQIKVPKSVTLLTDDAGNEK